MPFPPLPKEESGDELDDDEPLPEDDYGSDEDDFGAAIREAFPDQEWDSSRLAALKEAIRICAEGDKGDEPGLAVLLGEMSKSKKG
jgi:hypothetical protein